MNKSLSKQLQALANEAKIHMFKKVDGKRIPQSWPDPNDAAFVRNVLPKEAELFANMNTDEQARKWLIQESEAFLAQPEYEPSRVTDLPIGPEYVWRAAVRRALERARKDLATQLYIETEVTR